MNYELLKRYSLPEIALLAVFVLGLGLAQLIVKVRHRVILSDSIGLPGSGLSVGMPTNPGWEYEKAWRYESDNSMALVAQHQLGPSQEASLQWRYYFCSPAGTARELLQQRARQTASSLGTIETISQPIGMEYAVVFPAGDSSEPFYMGVARLDFGRRLELQVYPQQLDAFYAQNLFRALVQSIHYAPSEQLKHGKDLTTVFWDALKTDSLSLGKHADEAFLIKSTDNQPVGYSYQRYSTRSADQQTQLQLSLWQYEHNLSLLESTFWFNTAENRLTWKTTFQRAGMGSPRVYTVASEPDGTITIKTNVDKEVQFVSDSLFLPELLLPPFATLLLDSEQDTVIFDVLSPTGSVVPIKMEKIDIKQALAHSEQIAYAIKIEFLNNSNSFEELYFDAQRQFLGQFEQQPLRQRLWDLTTPDELKRIFGDNFQVSNDKVAIVKETRASSPR